MFHLPAATIFEFANASPRFFPFLQFFFSFPKARLKKKVGYKKKFTLATKKKPYLRFHGRQARAHPRARPHTSVPRLIGLARRRVPARRGGRERTRPPLRGQTGPRRKREPSGGHVRSAAWRGACELRRPPTRQWAPATAAGPCPAPGAATRPKLPATRRRKSEALRQPPPAHHRRASHRDNDSAASPLHSWGCARRRPRRRRRCLVF